MKQLHRIVRPVGNSGGVLLPREWLNREVIVTFPGYSLEELKKEILTELIPYLKDVIGVYIYGSYARNEQRLDSDVDVLVITNKKIKVMSKFNLIVIENDKVKEAIKKNPILIAPILREAISVLNEDLLKELNKIKIDKKKFKWFLDNSKESLKSIKELIDLDKLTSKYLLSYSIVYSLILRLRGVYLIKCILANKKYTNKDFYKWLNGNDDLIEVYINEKNNKRSDIKIKVEVVERLYKFLEKELNKLK